MAIRAAEIRQKVRDLVDGRVSLREFQAWFLPATWELNEAEPVAEDLAAEIELRLAEFSNGHWTESELVARLAGLQVPSAVDSAGRQ